MVIVSFPISKTEPAKFIPTSTMFTSHIITSLILFNWSLAFWAIFCVNKKPLCCSSTPLISLLPLSCKITCARLMIFLATLKAEDPSTRAFNCICSYGLYFNTIVTIWSWAPSHRFTGFWIYSGQLFVVLWDLLFCYIFSIHSVRNYNVTAFERTFPEEHVFWASDLIHNILSQAFSTDIVVTFKVGHFTFRLGIEAHGA